MSTPAGSMPVRPCIGLVPPAVVLAAIITGLMWPAFAQDDTDEQARRRNFIEVQTEQQADTEGARAGDVPQPPPVAGEAAPPIATRPAGAAGNVADAPVPGSTGDAPVPGREVIPSPDGRQPSPGVVGGSIFSQEELEQLGLPGFAENQPGFIPDTMPGDLFLSEREGKFAFQSLLGETKLPGSNVVSLIGEYNQDPSADLEDNHARIVVPTGTIEGSTETKQFHIEGGLILYYSDVAIAGETADIDEKNETAVLSGNVTIIDPKYELKTDELRIYFEAKKFQAVGFVQFKKLADPEAEQPDLSKPKKDRLRDHFAGQNFELYCKSLYYDWETKEMTAIDAVRIVHPSFNGTMERIDYNDETKVYEMAGTVILEVTDYDWIFENELVDDEDRQKVESLTDGETKITCDRVVYSEDSGVAEFYANAGSAVGFEQPSRQIHAAYIEINDDTKDFYAEGESEKSIVKYHQTDGEWLLEGGLIDRNDVSEDLVESVEKELTADALTFTYNFDRKRLELAGSVKIKGNDKTIEAGQVIQDETAKFFLMRDNVIIQPDETSLIRAAQVFIDTENDVFTFVGLVEGKMKSDDLVRETGEDGIEGGSGIQIQQGVFQQTGLPDQSPGRGISGVHSNAVRRAGPTNNAENG